MFIYFFFSLLFVFSHKMVSVYIYFTCETLYWTSISKSNGCKIWMVIAGWKGIVIRWCSTKWLYFSTYETLKHTHTHRKKFVYIMTFYRFSIFMIALLYGVSVVCVSGHKNIWLAYSNIMMMLCVVKPDGRHTIVTPLFCLTHFSTSQSKRTFYIILKNRKQTYMHEN